MSLAILMIGYGAIASYVARKLNAEENSAYQSTLLGRVLARPGREEAAAVALGPAVRIVTRLDQIYAPIDYAVECAGHDALSSAREGGLDRVTYTSRKPPQAWMGSPADQNLDLDLLGVASTPFEGSVREAARPYPKNANVAAAIALPGLGLDDTNVRLIADPEHQGNRHEIEAEGAFGRTHHVMDGNPMPDNPKSSALTAMSVIHAIRRSYARVRI